MIIQILNKTKTNLNLPFSYTNTNKISLMDKNNIILQLKSQLFEMEQKMEYMCNLEDTIKKLNDENLQLITAKNQFEFEIKKANEYYSKIITDLQNQLSSYKENLQLKQNTNKKLFDENEKLKIENEKLKSQFEYINTNSANIQNDIDKLLEKQMQYEQTIHNMSQIQIDIKKENENLIKDNKNLVKVCKELTRKKNILKIQNDELTNSSNNSNNNNISLNSNTNTNKTPIKTNNVNQTSRNKNKITQNQSIFANNNNNNSSSSEVKQNELNFIYSNRAYLKHSHSTNNIIYNNSNGLRSQIGASTSGKCCCSCCCAYSNKNESNNNISTYTNEISKFNNIKMQLMEENNKLKNHILVLTDQNQSLINEIDRILHSNFSNFNAKRLQDIINENRNR